MTRLDLQTRLRNFFRNDVYYTADDLNNSIQDGLDEAVALTGSIYKSGTLTFLGGVTYYDLVAAFPDFIGLVAIFNNQIKRWMTPISPTKLDGFRIDWEVVGGTPWYFWPVNYRYIGIYQKPLATGYGVAYVFYVAAAPTLDDTTTIPIIDDHMQALENYCLTDLLEQQQEFTKASGMLKAYSARIEQLRLLMKSRRNIDRMLALR